MAPQPDVENPIDPFSLVGVSWPVESENAYHVAEAVADNAGTTAETQTQSASDAEKQTVDGMQGKTADSVSSGYASAATYLNEQSLTYKTISGWMLDAAGKIRGAKKHIANLVRAGTSEIRDALNSELSGTPATPSSSELTDKYRADIASVASKLTTELDSIGHSLRGDPGVSRTPSYVIVSTTSTPEHADPHAVAASYTGAQGAPVPEPHQLPEMPRATTTPTSESPSAPVTPAPTVSPHAVNPTLSNLVSGSGPSGTLTAPNTSSKSPSTPSGTSAGQGAQAHQPNEQRQNAKSAGLPHIPSIGLPEVTAAATSIATAVSSATAHQLPTTTAPSTPGSSLPASTGITPGVSGTPPMTPASPAGLSPVGGLPTAPVVQTPPASQGSPATPTPGVQTPSPQSPSPAPRGPVVDAAWLQQRYGLAPGIELPKSETMVIPALFIADLPEVEAHLHRALATIRHQFEVAGWSQPLAVARIKRGFETKLVYVTSDGLSIHPSGVLLPSGVIPLDEMTSLPATSRLAGSLMVTEKLTSLIPREWTVEHVLSTVFGEEGSQSAEQYQELVVAGELLNCSVSRCRSDVTDGEAMRVFARAALGSRGCGELEAESARLRGARWVGVQPAGYLDVLARWYLSDAAEAMSLGRWGEAVYASERYMSVQQSKSQAA